MESLSIFGFLLIALSFIVFFIGILIFSTESTEKQKKTYNNLMNFSMYCFGVGILLLVLASGGQGIDSFEKSLMVLVAIIIVASGLWKISRDYFYKLRSIEVPKLSGGAFLMKNIIAPVIVSLIVFSVTGEPSFTLVSVPIIGLISLSVGI